MRVPGGMTTAPRYDTLGIAPVAQWIECWPPEPETGVRISAGVLGLCCDLRVGLGSERNRSLLLYQRRASGCGLAARAPALGAGDRQFESAHPDHSPAKHCQPVRFDFRLRRRRHCLCGLRRKDRGQINPPDRSGRRGYRMERRRTIPHRTAIARATDTYTGHSSSVQPICQKACS